ncbi:hypothetical protein B0H13DRAFT_1900617 [Mycena leptocephala]|nr:hypothetical protein B0H13DRAFT_1900617 [Mycena leptocephala]
MANSRSGTSPSYFLEAEFQRRSPSAPLTNCTESSPVHTPNCSVFVFAACAKLAHLGDGHISNQTNTPPSHTLRVPNSELCTSQWVVALLIEPVPLPGTEEVVLGSELQDGITTMRMCAVGSPLIRSPGVEVYLQRSEVRYKEVEVEVRTFRNLPTFGIPWQVWRYKKVSRDDGFVMLRLTAEAIQLGILELCVATTFLLQCGKKILIEGQMELCHAHLIPACSNTGMCIHLGI